MSTRSRSARSEARRKVFCESYNNEDADIELLSTDGMIFKVHSYLLKTYSSVFHDSLRSPRTTCNAHEHEHEPERSPRPLPSTGLRHIDTPSDTLRLFLDFMRCRHQDLPKETTWSQYRQLLILCTTYDTFIIRERIMARLIGSIHTSPWDAFRLAGQMDDLDLARKAIAQMGIVERRRKSKISLRNVMPEDIDGIKASWLIGLLKLVSALRRAQVAESKLWSQVARHFKPFDVVSATSSTQSMSVTE